MLVAVTYLSMEIESWALPGKGAHQMWISGYQGTPQSQRHNRAEEIDQRLNRISIPFVGDGQYYSRTVLTEAISGHKL